MPKTTEITRHSLLICIATLCLLLSLAGPVSAQFDDDSFSPQQDDPTSRTFKPHSTDSSKVEKEVPKGIYVWTVDPLLGNIIPAEVDTVPHLFQNTALASGLYGDYNTIGNNYTPRISRIFIDRGETSQFVFTQPYSYFLRTPAQWHFTNTLSPITNLTYNSCGDKTNGEDLLHAKFAVNAGKRIGLGADINYNYARGYFQNQSTSHFSTSLFGSYLGDQYQLHVILSTNHQKLTESGGITNDEYITHKEIFTDQYQENEIPTTLSSNWNRLHHQHLFLNHRYNVGFYRRLPSAADSLAASRSLLPSDTLTAVSSPLPSDTLAAPTVADSLLAQRSDSVAAGPAPMPLPSDTAARPKSEFIPVTSFIHTLEGDLAQRTYIAYQSPKNMYADTFYKYVERGYGGDSIYDATKHSRLQNTLAIELHEGFNKYARAGLTAFVSHDLRRYSIPQVLGADSTARAAYTTEHSVSIGGQLAKRQGSLLHYRLRGQTWVAGQDAGQVKLDADADLNFPLLGDTVRLEARAFFHRLEPTFYQRHFHSKHAWWDNDGLSAETRTRIEGNLEFRPTKTHLRVAVEELTDYTYLAQSSTFTSGTGYTGLSVAMRQHSDVISILTAQVRQDIVLGPLHFDNVVTFQSSTAKEVVALPTLNLFANLYVQFCVNKVLRVELGGSATIFTKYDAPDYCPLLGQYAVQENADSRLRLGGFPFVDVYANMHLKRARFFVMMTNVANGTGNRLSFLSPHYPTDSSVLRFGVSWNFFN